MITRYYCSKCKTYIEPSLVLGAFENWVGLSHEVMWKNGITWYKAIHKIHKVIENDDQKIN